MENGESDEEHRVPSGEAEEKQKRRRRRTWRQRVGGYHGYQKPQSPPPTMREVSLTPGKATAHQHGLCALVYIHIYIHTRVHGTCTHVYDARVYIRTTDRYTYVRGGAVGRGVIVTTQTRAHCETLPPARSTFPVYRC